MKLKKFLASTCFLGFVLCMVGISLFPSLAHASFASLCGGFSRLNRPGCFGYFAGQDFYGTYGIQGQNIIDCTKAPSVCVNGESVNNAIPANVVDAASFIQWLQGYLAPGSGTGYDYNKAGAAFIVDTMLGRPGTNYGSTAAGIADAQNSFATWSKIVTDFDARGLITWDLATTLPAGTINSLHACWPSIPDCEPTNISGHDGGDFAFFRNPDPEASHVIMFHDPNNYSSILFEIRRECANVLGNVTGLPPPTYTLTPNVTSKVNGVNAATAEPGDTIQYTYTITNSSSFASSNPANCTIYQIDRAGYVTGSPGPGPGDPSQTFTCPAISSGGGYTIPATGSFASVIAGANTTYCRLLVVNPATDAGAPAQSEACVIVISKPYVKVFGGDTQAGAGFGTSCTEDANAAIVGWNQRGATFAGAGTEYAAYVLNTLMDFGTAQNGAAGSAATPSGLAFSNVGITPANQANGIFANSFGTSVPCLPDYIGKDSSKSHAVTIVPPGGLDLASLPNGPSTYTGNLQIGGSTLATGQNMTLYVHGNVYISGNLTYGGSWSVGQIPYLQLVVAGNIYVNGAVSRLDGSYIAQPNGGSGGTIYDCTDPASPYTALPLTNPNNPVYSKCATQLTVNGSFTGQNVELLRTAGTLRQSTPGENPGTTTAAEVFNYNPSVWIPVPQPATGVSTQTDTYDSIVDLPPVL